MVTATNISSVAVGNGHIDSLIEYVLDVKPYHTKLSEVVEQYDFNEEAAVKVTDSMESMVVMGQDYLRNSNRSEMKVWAMAPVRPESTLTADKIIQSDGVRKVYPIPAIYVNKLLSQSSQETFIGGDSPVDIPGLTSVNVFSPRKFDGPGIARVTLNGDPAIESIGYFVSNGVFSANIRQDGWKEISINGIDDAVIPLNTGALAYSDVNTPYGRITNIVCSDAAAVYDEWTLVWSDAENGLTVTGSSSGFVGVATFDTTFTSPEITFTFTFPEGETEHPFQTDGDTFVLTPSSKITIHPGATEEIWSLIKINPACITYPAFTSVNLGPTPHLNLFARGLDRTPACTFTITFTSSTQFDLSCSIGLADYPKIGLTTSKAFSDDFIHFAIDANGFDFTAGDTFEFDVLETKTNFLVYGSVSGWAEPASIGKWYDNGSIAFKVPALKYFPYLNGDMTQQFTGFEAVKSVHSVCQPSVYEIEFREPVSPLTEVTATVKNNIYGFRSGLRIGEIWSDEFCSFIITGEFSPGDKVSVFIAPSVSKTIAAAYDELPYDTSLYDVNLASLTLPDDLLQEYFPLTHSNGVVYIPYCQLGDAVVIDKVEQDYLRFKFEEPEVSGSFYPSLAETDGWVPLEFRYFDADGPAIFPNEPTYFSAYAASSPLTKMFDVFKPVGAAATMVLDTAFFNAHISPSSYFTLRFHQSDVYQQIAQVKFSESLTIKTISTEVPVPTGVLAWASIPGNLGGSTFNITNQTESSPTQNSSGGTFYFKLINDTPSTDYSVAFVSDFTNNLQCEYDQTTGIGSVTMLRMSQLFTSETIAHIKIKLSHPAVGDIGMLQTVLTSEVDGEMYDDGLFIMFTTNFTEALPATLVDVDMTFALNDIGADIGASALGYQAHDGSWKPSLLAAAQTYMIKPANDGYYSIYRHHVSRVEAPNQYWWIWAYWGNDQLLGEAGPSYVATQSITPYGNDSYLSDDPHNALSDAQIIAYPWLDYYFRVPGVIGPIGLTNGVDPIKFRFMIDVVDTRADQSAPLSMSLKTEGFSNIVGVGNSLPAGFVTLAYNDTTKRCLVTIDQSVVSTSDDFLGRLSFQANDGTQSTGYPIMVNVYRQSWSGMFYTFIPQAKLAAGTYDPANVK